MTRITNSTGVEHMATSDLIGTTVYDRFGAWTLELDEDGNWIAVQGSAEVLIMDHADMDRFGIECLPRVAA